MRVQKRSQAIRAVCLDAPEAMREQWYAPYVVAIDGSLRLLSECYQPAVGSYDPRHPQSKMTMTSAFTLDMHRVHRGATISSAAMPWMIEGHRVRETPGPGTYDARYLAHDASAWAYISPPPFKPSSIRGLKSELGRIRESMIAHKQAMALSARDNTAQQMSHKKQMKETRIAQNKTLCKDQRLQSQAIASARNQMLKAKYECADALRHDSSKRWRMLQDFEASLRQQAWEARCSETQDPDMDNTDGDWLELLIDRMPMNMLIHELTGPRR